MLHKTIVTDPLTGTQFNDYEVLNPKLTGLETEDVKFDYTTQVCTRCAKKHKLADGIDYGIGAGTCGVVGCERPAVHNYSFLVEGPPTVESPFFHTPWRKSKKKTCLLYTSPSPRDRTRSRMPSSA